MTQEQQTFKNLEDIQLRKAELKAAIQEDGEKLSLIWHELIAPQESGSKGEMIASLVSNSITAIDGFLLVRKLIKGYGFLFKRKSRKKK